MQKSYPNIVGASIPKFYPVIGTSERSRERTILRKVWNTNQVGNCNRKVHRRIGGFRVVMNAGDVLSRVNNPCGGSNQISSRPGMLVMSKRDGVRKCKNDIPVANTNVKWVYDSSDYIRYRKESSINAGYAGTNSCKKPPLTDYSYGGSGAPLGRGRQIRINGSSSYGSNI